MKIRQRSKKAPTAMQRTLAATLGRVARSQRTLSVTPAIFRATPASSRQFGASSFRFYSETKKEAEPETKSENESEVNESEAGEGEKKSELVTELEAKLQKKDKDLADMKNHYARAIADFRNLQESTKKEVAKAKDFALQKFAKDLLESIDNFTLALNAVNEETLEKNNEVKNLYEGVSMTRNVFEKTLQKHGIEKIDPLDEEFDPNLHEATFQLPHPDKKAGTVFHVQQPGYTLNSRVLRPAKVGLVKDAE